MKGKRLVFAIGGPFGHAQHLHSHAWKSMALSKMVLNHELLCGFYPSSCIG